MVPDIYDYCGSCDKNGEDDKHCKLCLRQTLSIIKNCPEPQQYKIEKERRRLNTQFGIINNGIDVKRKGKNE